MRTGPRTKEFFGDPSRATACFVRWLPLLALQSRGCGGIVVGREKVVDILYI